MKQKAEVKRTGAVKGALLVLGAIAVGAASGVGLDYALPYNEHGFLAKLNKDRADAATELATAEARNQENAAAEGISESEPVDVATSEPTAPAEEVAIEEPVEVVEANPAAAATEEPALEQAPVEEAAVEPAAVPAPAPKVAAAVAAKPKKSSRSPSPQAEDPANPWWVAGNNDTFGVQYVGQVAGQTSMAILFSRDLPAAASLDQTVKVLDKDGKLVDGEWTAGNNSRLLVRPNLRPGRYTLVIDRKLASADGEQLQAALRGPVYIR